MVKLALNVTGEFTNVKKLEPEGGVHNADFGYVVKLKCAKCHTIHQKEVCLSYNEAIVVPSAKGRNIKAYVHFQMKCKECREIGKITLISGRGVPLTNDMIEDGRKACLMVFDCFVVEPVNFNFSGCWNILSVAGTLYEKVEFDAGDFMEYDANGKCMVQVSNLTATFDRIA